MPELGKATYFVTVNSKEFDSVMPRMQATARSTATSVDASMGTITASTEEAGAAATQMGVETEAAGVKSAAGAQMAGAGWKRAGASISAMGKKAFHMAGLAGLGALYFVVKGGLEWLKDTNKGMQLVKGSIESTGGVAGVTAKHASELARGMTKIEGATEGASLQIEQLLLRFTNIRNVGPGSLAIFDRAFLHVNNIATATHRSTTMIALALGRVIQDPIKNLGSLGRAGVTFSKKQKSMIEHIFKTSGALKTQTYILDILDKRYGGAAKRFGSSFVGQMDKAKDAIQKASAEMLTAFIPTFKQAMGVLARLARWMARNTDTVKKLVLAFIAFKVAMMGVGLVAMGPMAWLAVALIGLYVKSNKFRVSVNHLAVRLQHLGGTIFWIVKAMAAAWTRMRAFRVIIYTVAAATVVLVGRIYLLKSALISVGSAPVILAIMAVVAAMYLLMNAINQTKAAQDNLDATLNASQANEEINAYYAERVKMYMGKGKTRLQATKLAGRDAKAHVKDFGKNKPDSIVATGKPSNLHGVKPPKPPKAAPGYAAPAPLSEFSEPTDTGGKKKKKKKGLHGGVLSGDDFLPVKMQLAYQRALRTKSLKDDEKVLEMEETYLKGLLKNRKLTLKKRLAIEKELTAVERRLVANRKKLEASVKASRAEFQAAMDLRGTFFAQFASDIFHQTAAGLEMGSQKVEASTSEVNKTMNYTQNNHYNEIPKNKHIHAQQMKAATAAAN